MSEFLLYLDDSGSRVLTPDDAGGPLDHFAIGGVLLRAEDKSFIEAEIMELKQRWNLGEIPFHSLSIRRAKHAFAWLGHDEDRRMAFLHDLEALILRQPFHVFACVIHRRHYLQRFCQPPKRQENWQMCRTAYSIVVEKAAKHALASDRTLRVFMERSGKREDALIRSYHADLAARGLPFDNRTSAKYGPLQAEDFGRVLGGADVAFRAKSSLLTQLADLVLYPVSRGGFDPEHQPFVALRDAGKLCPGTDVGHGGRSVKYYCFSQPS